MAGKGGVGKTTVTATLARRALLHDRTVAVVTTQPSQISPLLEVDAVDAHTVLEGSGAPRDGLTVVTIDPRTALEAYLEGRRLGAIGRRLSRTGMLDLVATAVPGIEQLVVLSRLRQLEQLGRHDLIVMDGPASGQALALLRAPHAVSRLARSGPLAEQADAAGALLSDPTRTQVVLVTRPAHTSVTETIETAFALEEDLGLTLGPVVVNGCSAPAPAGEPPTSELAPALPPAVAAAVDRALDQDHRRHLDERAAVAQLEERLGLKMIVLPDGTTPSGGVDLDLLVRSVVPPR